MLKQLIEQGLFEIYDEQEEGEEENGEDEYRNYNGRR